MKIYIPNAYKKNTTGKGLFCNRLATSLLKKGVTLVKDIRDKHDISLHLARSEKSNAVKKIIRFDGIYHDKMLNFKKRNKPLKSALHNADAVIYQSNFSKKLCNAFLGEYQGNSIIIPNGASVDFYKKITSVNRSKYKTVVLTASRWRPHKRLKDIIESYLLSNISNSILFIAGDIKDSGLSNQDRLRYISLDNVKFLGLLSQEDLSEYLIASDMFLHLCWLDNCPNAVVEAICSGTPVICNNVGGTNEIVGGTNGIICEIDKPYKYTPCDLYHPPLIDRSVVADAIKQLSVQKKKNNFFDLNIDNIADKYINFFEKVLK